MDRRDILGALQLTRDKQAIAFKALRDHIIANKDPTVQLHKLMEEYQRLCRQNDTLDRKLGAIIQAEHAAHGKDVPRSAAHGKDVPRAAAHGKDVPVRNPMRSSSHSPDQLHCFYFHREGGCKDGDKCKHKHAPRCRDLKTTGCKRGVLCHFSHNF